ncbi:hypothetical protein [Lysobacter enzymogenes]|uniref:hypothetical protein n=1 Tax=Lysobacter enzymogenes TaxID=69 RepID=UPI0014417AA9|nr:hypothetical protein [Lysobacter enzymogenes]
MALAYMAEAEFAGLLAGRCADSFWSASWPCVPAAVIPEKAGIQGFTATWL